MWGDHGINVLGGEWLSFRVKHSGIKEAKSEISNAEEKSCNPFRQGDEDHILWNMFYQGATNSDIMNTIYEGNTPTANLVAIVHEEVGC